MSDSVRRSAGRLRDEDGAPATPRHRDDSGAGVGGEAPRDRFGVPRRTEPEGRPPEPEEPAPEPAWAERVPWVEAAVARAGSPERAAAALGILLIALIALIWLLIAVLGDDGGGETPTATEVMQVVPFGDSGTPGAASTPGAGPGRGIVTPTPSPPPAVTPTPSSGGSDNMLDQVPASPEAGSVSDVSCAGPCMARVERTPEASSLLLANGTRPSYAGDDWLWVVADPEAIASISGSLETEIVREGDDTLRLYMVTLPEGGGGEWAAWEVGEVIDEVGRYRLVEAATAPANVETAIDAGVMVEKVAPAPLEMTQRGGGLPALQEADVGGLANDVDAGALETDIATLQAFGAPEGQGAGTRHYTTAGNQAAAEYLFQRLESYGLRVWYEDFVSWDGLLLVSVVGEIPGRDTSRLYGVIAHFDTTSETPGTLAPGADDNATGVASTLEIARILAGYDLKYSFRVIFVNYEEEGVVGSQEFAQDAVAAGDPWEGIFNVDSVGSGRNGYTIILNAEGESIWMQELIQRVNDAYGLGETLQIEQSDEIVADDNRLRDEGIESVMIARELYGWSPYHHTSADVIGNISISHTERAAVLVLLTVASLLV